MRGSFVAPRFPPSEDSARVGAIGLALEPLEEATQSPAPGSQVMRGSFVAPRFPPAPAPD